MISFGRDDAVSIKFALDYKLVMFADKSIHCSNVDRT